MARSPIAGDPRTVAYVAVFLDISKPTLYRWMQQGDLPYEDYGGLTDRHISIEDTMRVKVIKRPGRPKKKVINVRNRPANYELGSSFQMKGDKKVLDAESLNDNGAGDPASVGETMAIVLETSRLILRHLELNDLNDLHKLYSDPEIRKYFPEGVLTLAETREHLEWYMNGPPDHPELGLWATIHKATGLFIGRCGLLPWEIEGKQEVEIAYLLDKLFWHQGLATEAAQGILEYGFEKLNLSRLICLMAPENSASQRVAQRVGMSLEGKVDGVAADNFLTLIYAINKPYTS